MKNTLLFLLLISLAACTSSPQLKVITVNGEMNASEMGITLEHEHVLVDFIGADSITPDRYDAEEAFQQILPYLMEVKAHGVKTFVECTPNYIGRNPQLLKRLSKESGLNILTNTGFYGAQTNKFIPKQVMKMPAEDIARFWIAEFEQGIEGTGVKPGFIKIGVDRGSLSDFHKTLVKAAAITHRETGLTIMSHTGPATPAFEELEILEKEGVAPEVFIWTHASDEKDWDKVAEAAQKGCWVSLDNFGWNEEALNGDELFFLKEQGVLNRVLISHDAGWVQPGKPDQPYKPYTAIFETLIPNLKASGFTDEDIETLLVKNPAEAFAVRTRLLNREPSL